MVIVCMDGLEQVKGQFNSNWNPETGTLEIDIKSQQDSLPGKLGGLQAAQIANQWMSWPPTSSSFAFPIILLVGTHLQIFPDTKCRKEFAPQILRKLAGNLPCVSHTALRPNSNSMWENGVFTGAKCDCASAFMNCLMATHRKNDFKGHRGQDTCLEWSRPMFGPQHPLWHPESHQV